MIGSKPTEKHPMKGFEQVCATSCCESMQSFGDTMDNLNELMDNFKDQLNKGMIQKAYRHIFDIFVDLGNELKSSQENSITVNSLYHGYLDMTYLPAATDLLKVNGLKVAIVFNYSLFQFQIWLAAVNRKKRKEVLALVSRSKWNKYKAVENDENTDAILELQLTGICEFGNKSRTVSLITKETINFINEIELFIKDTMILVP